MLGWRGPEKQLATEPFKDGLVAALPIVAAAVPEFTPPTGTPAQLRKGVGQLTNIPYGVSFASMARTLRDYPDVYGKNWGSAQNLRTLIERGSAHDDRIKILKDMRDEYLETCRALVLEAERRDAYAGVTFIDLFDGARVRYHSPARVVVELGNGALPLYTSMPQGEIRDREYPVNYLGAVRKVSGGRERRHLKGSLLNAFAPCLIHTLDAAFAGHVIEALDAQGVRDIVAINDCFLVPSDALPTLPAATKAAGRPWFLSLGPFYDVFEHYLGDDPVYGPRVRGWREIWQRRVDAGNDWPQLLMKRETTLEFVW